jgi:hypothetical protein
VRVPDGSDRLRLPRGQTGRKPDPAPSFLQ